MKTIKVVENTCLNNEVTIEELDKNLRATVKMASDNEQKLDELSRKLGVQEAELKRAVERAELAEKNPPTTSRSLTSSPGSWVCRRLSSRGLWRGPSWLRRPLRGSRSWLRRSTTCRASTRSLRPGSST